MVEGEPPAPVEERYAAAVDVLIALHGQQLPDTLPVAPHVQHKLPRYDMDALLMEAELLLDWYLPSLGAKISEATRTVYVAMWREALQAAIETDLTWVLRDFHSPNLLWLPDREGVATDRPARFPGRDDRAGRLRSRLAAAGRARRRAGRHSRFRCSAATCRSGARPIRISIRQLSSRRYATLAAQRASKILGIFARLDRRDGKPQYLRHIPRVWAYLQRSLAHPSLATLNGWYSVHVPKPGA